jgi:hypothetical protein
MRLAAVVTVVGAILAGGCSDDESSGPTSGPPTTESTMTAQRIADEAVFSNTDLPAGWSWAGADGQDNVEDLIADCGSDDPSSVPDDGDPRALGNWQSADAFVGSKVEINPDENQAESTLSALRTSAGQECFAEALASAFPSELGVGDFTLVERPSDGLGDDAIAFRAEVPLTYEGDTFTWYSDLIIISQGPTLVDLSFGHADEPMTDAEQERLIEAVLERAESAEP